MTSIGPGWYKDPAAPTTQRYWDGESWVGDPLPADATPPEPRAKEAGEAPAGTPTKTVSTPPGAEVIPPSGLPPGTLPPGTSWPPGWPPGLPIHPSYARLFMPAPRPHGYPLADIGRRLVARLVDVGVLIVINAAVNGWFIYRLYQEVWPWYKAVYHRAQAHLPLDDVPQPQNTQSLAFTITLIAAALWFAYEVPAVANRGQTLGKRLLGIKVLRLEADGPIGFGRALRRWNPMGFATLLWTCGVGFILQFVDCLFVAVDRPLHQALHDKSAATVVVDVNHADVKPINLKNESPGTENPGTEKPGDAR